MEHATSKPDTVTITTNFWRVPSVETAFSGWLEGTATEAEKLLVIAKTEAARAAWKPSPEAMDLVEQLRRFIGNKVTIQMWDNDMRLFPEEGPHPFAADFSGVIIIKIDGFQQAFLEVANVRVLPTPEGYDPLPFLQTHSESKYALVPLATLYEVSKS
jgi:hypothetical protein